MIYRKSYLTKKHTVLVNVQNKTKDVATLKLGVGETISRYANGVTMAKWNDKRNVLYISSEFLNYMIQISNCKAKKK